MVQIDSGDLTAIEHQVATIELATDRRETSKFVRGNCQSGDDSFDDAKLGIKPAHTGKAQSAHAKTEIFYAVGFDGDAKKIADALHVEAKPVTWSTGYAITVAVAKAAP